MKPYCIYCLKSTNDDMFKIIVSIVDQSWVKIDDDREYYVTFNHYRETWSIHKSCLHEIDRISEKNNCCIYCSKIIIIDPVYKIDWKIGFNFKSGKQKNTILRICSKRCGKTWMKERLIV